VVATVAKFHLEEESPCMGALQLGFTLIKTLRMKQFLGEHTPLSQTVIPRQEFQLWMIFVRVLFSSFVICVFVLGPYQIGTPVPRTLCSYTILGASKRRGDLISPTYPGVYPKNLSCSYKFIGIEGQRIRLEFRDFDVFYGGAQ